MKRSLNTIKRAFSLFLCLACSVVYGQQPIKRMGSRPAAEPKANQLSIYPNPASNQFTIDLPYKKREGFDLEIHSKPGTRVLAQKWNGEKIDVSAFPAGVYIVTLKRKQEIYSQKLVVNR